MKKQQVKIVLPSMQLTALKKLKSTVVRAQRPSGRRCEVKVNESTVPGLGMRT